MTATLWLDTDADEALSLGGTIQLYKVFQEMALLDGPGFEKRWPELFGVPYQVEDGDDADPDWMRDVVDQADRFLVKHAGTLSGYSAGVLKVLVTRGREYLVKRKVPLPGPAAVGNEGEGVVGAFLLDDEPAPNAEDGRANRPFAAAGADGLDPVARAVNNIFCPTGKGGGIDPTCKAGADKGVGPGAGAGASGGGAGASPPQPGWERQEQPNGVTVDTKTGGTRTRLISDKGEAEVWQGAGDKQWRMKHGGDVQVVGSKEEGLARANQLLATRTPPTVPATPPPPRPAPTPAPSPAPSPPQPAAAQPTPKNLPKTNDLSPDETKTALARLAQLPKDRESDYGKAYNTDSVRVEALGMKTGEFRPEFSQVASPAGEKKGRLGNVPLDGIKTSQDAIAAGGLAAYSQRQPDPKKDGWPEVAKYPDGTYQIISGHTRLGAVALAGRTHGRAKVYTFDENGRLVGNEAADGAVANDGVADPATAPNLLDIWEDADAWWWPEVVDRLKQKALAFLAGDYYGQPGVVEEGRDRLEGFDNLMLDLGRVIDESLSDPDVQDGALDMLVDAYLDGAEMAYRDAGPGGGRDQMREFIAGVVTNIFCPTGKGGGVDPTCKAGGLGGYRAAAHGPPAPTSTTPTEGLSRGVLKAIQHHTAAGGPLAGAYSATDKERAELRRWVDKGEVSGPVYRVLSFKSDDASYAFSRPGKVVEAGTSGFVTSWSVDKDRAPLEGGASFVRVEIVGKATGRDVSEHSVYKQEKEILTPTNSKFKVLEAEYISGFGWQVKVEQVEAGKEPTYVTQLLGNAPTANATPPRDVWGQFMSAKAKEMSDRLAAGWRVQAGAVSQGIANVVTRGIAAAKSADEISAEILGFSAAVPRARADTIARTEVTRAAAEGQLDAYGRLGVSEISVDRAFELRTQGKNSCPECVALEKLGPMPVEKARGLIPVHPQCKCRWRVVLVPAAVTNELVDAALNIFCPTGRGGGIDPTCKAGADKGVGPGAGGTPGTWENGRSRDFSVYGTTVEVLKNPSKLQLLNLVKGSDDNMAKGIMVDGAVYVFSGKENGKDIYHEDVYQSMTGKPELPGEHRFVVTGSPKGPVVHSYSVRHPVVKQWGDSLGIVVNVANADLDAALNIFCPTGKGGGIDPTCGKGGVTRKQSAAAYAASGAILDHAGRQPLTSHQALALTKQMGKLTTAQLRQLKADYGVRSGGGTKAEMATRLRGKILSKLDEARDTGPKPQPPKPAPKTEPAKKTDSTPPPQPPKAKLPHPELDPSRAPLTVAADQYGPAREFRGIRSQADIDRTTTSYNSLVPEKKLQVMEYYGIKPETGPDGKPSPLYAHQLSRELRERAVANLAQPPIAEQLKNSPHAEATARIAALDQQVRDNRERRSKLWEKENDLAFKQAETLDEAQRVALRRDAATSNVERQAMQKRYDKLRAKADALGNEIDQAGRERARLSEAEKTITQQAHAIIHEELNKTGRTHRLTQADLPHAPEANATNLNREIDTARAFLDGKVVARPGDPALAKVENTTNMPPGEREHYNPYGAQKQIVLTPDRKADVVIHEYGHHIEEVVPGVHKAAVAFLNHRVGNEQPVKLKDRYPDSGYKEWEEGRRDDFAKAYGGQEASAYYVGKKYPNDRFTEVVAMGVQQMYHDPVKFAKNDPEYFNFVMGMLSGEHREKTLPDN